MPSFLPSVALVTAAFLFGCQDVGTGPVGPEVVPQFGGIKHPDGPHGGGGDDKPDPGTLFSRPGGVDAGDGFTCAGGTASSTTDQTFGTVNFNQPRDHSHIHANVQLRGAPQGNYNIFGNQELMCLEKPTDTDNTFVDFFLRPNHDRTVSVGANGKGKARIGLDFGGPNDLLGPDSHLDGPHKLWVTLVGISGAATNVILRSTFDVVVIPVHEGH